MATINDTPNTVTGYCEPSRRALVEFSLDDDDPHNSAMYWNGRFIDLVKTPPEYWPDTGNNKAKLVATVERWKQARACGATMGDAHGYAMAGAGMAYPEWHKNEERKTREAIRRYRMAREVAA